MAQRATQDFVSPAYETVEPSATTIDFSELEPAPSSEPITIEQCVQLALERNPKIAAARHQVAALRHRIPQALALPDPMVSTTTHLAPVQTAAGEQRLGLGVQQKMVRADRRSTQASIAHQEMKAAEANLAKVQLEVAEQIRVACYQLLFINESMAIVREDQKLLENIASVVRRQYETLKEVSQQDWLNVQREQSEVENQLTRLKQKQQVYRARIARLTHLQLDSLSQIEGRAKTHPANWNLAELTERAKQARPELVAQLAIIEKNRKKVTLAELNGRPDFTLGFNWIATSSNGISPVANGDDAFLLGVGFNLPIHQGRIRAGICEATANQRASTSQYESLQDEIAEEVFDLISQAESLASTLKLVQQDIIPKAEQIDEISLEAYSTGKIDFVQLIGNWRALNRFRIREADMRARLNQVLASLARAVGELEPLDDGSLPPDVD